MPTYRIKLANGKSLVLRGDEPPSDSDIEAAATQAGVRSLLMRSSDKGEHPAKDASISPSIGAAVGYGATGAMAAAPTVANLGGKVAAAKFGGVSAAPVMLAADAAGRVIRGDYSGAAKEAAGAYAAQQAVKRLPMIQRLAGMLRGASPYAAVATLPFADSGDRPAGETAETTAARQKVFEREHQRIKQGAKPRSTAEIAREVLQEMER